MATKHVPFFKFYPADFMNGVRGMSPQEVGVYQMLLCRIYEESGPVEHNPLRLSTYCGMRETTFKKTLEKLVDLGKITIVDGMLSNPRAEREISGRANDLKNNSKAGKASAEKRQQKQREMPTDVQRTLNHTDTDTDTDTTATQKPEKQPQIEAEKSGIDPDELLDAVKFAVGLTGGRIPTYWMPPASTAHVHRWHTELGLTEAEIIDVARENRKHHDSAPNGPKALDGAMKRMADAKTAPISQQFSNAGSFRQPAGDGLDAFAKRYKVA